MPNVPNGFKEWPQDDGPDLKGVATVKGTRIPALYAAGYAGITDEPEEREKLLDILGDPIGESACHKYGLAESGKGKLSLPYLAAYRQYPGCWPHPAQTTGDCVSHGTANACLITLGVEASQGVPDEVTGKIEGFPEVPKPDQGVIATEPIDHDRGHSGQGASCDRLARHVVEWGGVMLRQDYPELGVDLTNYNASIGSRWGGRGTPDKVKEVGKLHQIRTVTTIRSREALRDLLANGYGVNTCSGMGFSSKRDENGVSRQQGSWSHSQAIGGFDDRPEIWDKYKDSLCLWMNSWGEWNSGPRRILGTDIDIPHGCYWVKTKTTLRASLLAFSGANGWPRQDLSDYGAWLI